MYNLLAFSRATPPKSGSMNRIDDFTCTYTFQANICSQIMFGISSERSLLRSIHKHSLYPNGFSITKVQITQQRTMKSPSQNVKRDIKTSAVLHFNKIKMNPLLSCVELLGTVQTLAAVKTACDKQRLTMVWQGIQI